MKISKVEKGSSLLPAIKDVEKELEEKLKKIKLEAEETTEEEETKRGKAILKFKEDIGNVYERIYQDGLKEIDKVAKEMEAKSEEELKRLKKKYCYLTSKIAEEVFKRICSLT
ncbi:MAG: hypothetical protein QMD92_02000 [bacterium]|nr:hypothetical protein [bacterium]